MWTDCSSALADQIHNGSSLFVTDGSTPKTLLRPIDRLAFTFEVHSDRTVCATHISTSRTALRWIVSRPSPNSFATIRAFSQPTSAHRKPCLAMRLLSLTVATHSDPSVRTADISRRTRRNREPTFGAHRSNAQRVDSPRCSHADVKAVHKRKPSCSQSRETSAPPASVPKGSQSPARPRPASLRRRRSPTKSTALRVPSTPTYPHTRPTSSPTPTRFIVETPTAKPNRGERILPRNAPAARAHTLPRPNMSA